MRSATLQRAGRTAECTSEFSGNVCYLADPVETPARHHGEADCTMVLYKQLLLMHHPDASEELGKMTSMMGVLA